MSFWVYILCCADGSYYTGHTDNLEKRIGEHQAGACGGYTATRLPVELAWSQECATRVEALSAEIQVKGWSRKKKEAMMQENWQEVNRLSRGKHRHQRLVADASSPPALHASTSLAMPATLHPSTSDTSCPTLRANGVVDVGSTPHTPVRPEPFDRTQDKLRATEPKGSQNPLQSVHPERSVAKSKGLSVTEGKL